MKSRFYTKAGLHGFLSTLETSTEKSLTVYMTPASFPEYAESLALGAEYDAFVSEIRKAIKNKAVIDNIKRYSSGAGIFWNRQGKHIVLPPFPIARNDVHEGKFDTSVLYDVLDKKHIIAVVLINWGNYALGMFDGSSLVECKIGTGYIHKEHKKGGRSQKRFARRTEEQKRDFLRRVGNTIEERFGGYLPDHVFFGGNRLILKPLIQECRYLQTRTDRMSSRILDVRRVDREAMIGILTEINKSMVFTF